MPRATLTQEQDDFLAELTRRYETEAERMVVSRAPYLRDTGKVICYIGWFWRSCGPGSGGIVLGHCGQFKGIMQRNKWGFSQRFLSDQEVDVLGTLTDAIRAHADDLTVGAFNSYLQGLPLDFVGPYEEEQYEYD